MKIYWQIKKKWQVLHYIPQKHAAVIQTCLAHQQPNNPCIRMLIDRQLGSQT